eukprot:1145842-Pelagomonas_calceolata.AAC.1
MVSADDQRWMEVTSARFRESPTKEVKGCPRWKMKQRTRQRQRDKCAHPPVEVASAAFSAKGEKLSVTRGLGESNTSAAHSVAWAGNAILAREVQQGY